MPRVPAVAQTLAVNERVAAIQTWVLRGAVFALPLVYSPFTYDGYVLPKLLAARAVLIVLIALHLARFAVSRSGLVRRSSLDVAWLVFLASAALSTLTAINANVA